MAHQVFISYAKEDKPIADAVCQALEAGEVRCWYAPRDITLGVDYEEEIIDAIGKSRLMILILSSHSNSSSHVKREVQNAFSDEAKVAVLPFQVEDVMLNKSLKYYVGSVHWLSALTPPLEDHLQKLVESVRARLLQDKPERDSVAETGAAGRTKSIEESRETRLHDQASRWQHEPGPALTPGSLEKLEISTEPASASVAGAVSSAILPWRKMRAVAATKRRVYFLVITSLIVLAVIAFVGTRQRKTTIDPAAAANAARAKVVFDQKKYAEAETYYLEAVRLDPNNAAYNNWLGGAFFSQGKYVEAGRYFGEALRLEPDGQGNDVIRNNLGNALMRQQRYKEAGDQFHQAMTLSPNNPMYYFTLGKALAAQQRYAEAEMRFKGALQLDPYNAEYHNSLGDALDAQRKVTEALDHYREAVRIAPTNPIFQANRDRLNPR